MNDHTRGARAVGAGGPGDEAIGANGAADAIWTLRLYVTGQTSRSLAAFTNLKALCERYLSGRYEIELVDLLEQPGLAFDNQILATPTVVRQQPLPVRKVIGDLSDSERALAGLELART